MSLTRKILFWFILLALAGILSLAAAELMLRLTVKTQDQLPGYVSHSNFYTYPSDINFSFTNEDGKQISIHTDENGLRNQPGALEKADVILVGDSFIFGINTNQEQTLTGCLLRKGIKAYNAGMGGYSTYNELFLLRNLIRKVHPSSVILFFYLGNDFHDNYFDRSHLSASNAAYTTTRPGSFNLISEVKHSLGKLCLKSKAGTILYQHVYCRWFKSPSWKVIASLSLSEMLSYRLVPNAEMKIAEEKTDQAFQELAKLGREKGIKIYLVGIPSKAQVYQAFHEISNFSLDDNSRNYALETIKTGYSFARPDQIAHALAAKNGLEYISLLPLFRANRNRNIYYQIDSHWTAQGQKLAADYLLHTIFKTAGAQNSQAARTPGAIPNGP